MSRILSFFISLILILLVLTPVSSAFAADPAVGNEVLDAADATLTRTGAGTAASPYKLQLNLSNSNTWLSPQIFNSGITVASVLTSSSISNSGNITAGGDVAVNGGNLTSTATTFNLVNTGVTTINIGGAATTVSLGSTTGTTTVKHNLAVNGTSLLTGNVTAGGNLSVSGTSVTAASATAAFDTVHVGSGYGNTGSSLYTNGNIATNGDLIVDGTSTLTGNVATVGNMAVNGGSLTTVGTIGNLFNTNATTLNIGGAATALTLGASTGTTSVRSGTVSFPNATLLNAATAAVSADSANIGGGYGSTGVTVSSSGNVQANGNLTVDGTSTLTGNTTTNGTFMSLGPVFMGPGGTNDVAIITDSDSTLNISGLMTGTGTTLCLDASNNVIKCMAGGSDLQAAYDAGNSIATSNSRNITFTLSDTVSDSGFVVTTATGATGYTLLERANGAGSATPAQLLLVNNADTDSAQPVGIKVQASTGGMTTAIDLSDANIATAVSLGSNNVVGTNFSLTGSNGNITTSGDLAVNGGDITTFASTANLFNTTVTTLNIGNATTTINIGGLSGTTTVNNDLSVIGAAAFNGGATVTSGQTFTANGQSDFNPSGTHGVTFNLDTDSYMTLNGLITSSGDPLCLDSSNNVVKCAASGSATMAAPAQTTSNSDLTTLQQTVKTQQDEIDALKAEVDALKAKVQ